MARPKKDAAPTKPAVTPVQQTPLPLLMGGLLPSRETLDVVKEVAGIYQGAGMAEGTREQIIGRILRGLEIGVPPGQACRDLYLGEDGSLGMRAGLMRAMVERSGKGHIEVPTFTPTCVKVVGVRGTRRQEVEWTIERARSLGLVKVNGPWEKYPAESLFGRATSMLCRLLFEDVLSGAAYVPEELGGSLPPDNAAPAPAAAAPSTGPAGGDPAPASATPRQPPASTGKAPGAPETPVATPTPTQPPPPAAGPAVDAPSANGGRPPAQRVLSHSFPVDKPGGGTQTLTTGGMTEGQLREILRLTSEKGGQANWQALREAGRTFVQRLGLQNLYHLTQAEAGMLIGQLTGKETASPPAAVPGRLTDDPAWMTALERLNTAIEAHHLGPHSTLIREYVERTGRAPLSEVGRDVLLEAAKFVEQHGGDTQTFVLLLERARQDATVA